MPEFGLGRLEPTDDRHVQLYALTAQTVPSVPTPVVLGINWYQTFDQPFQDKDGHYYIGIDKNLGRVRGGHAVCLKPPGVKDPARNWEHYNQGTEGACVGFAWSRFCSLMNKRLYDGFALYHEARRIDEWPGEDYDGTSVRAGGDILRDKGHWVVRNGETANKPNKKDGIEQNRWCTSVEEIALVLCGGNEDEAEMLIDSGYFVLLNSWGKNGYPHETRVPVEVIDRVVFREGGDASLATDRPGRALFVPEFRKE